MHKIRTTMQPWLTREVDESTLTDLTRQHLLVEVDGTPVGAVDTPTAGADEAGTGERQDNPDTATPTTPPTQRRNTSGDSGGKAGK